MSITFNADEIFEMAEEIERNAEKFYRQAAKIAPDKETKKYFLDLAVMEAGHLITFEEMRAQLSPQEKTQSLFDPDNQAALYLKTMADSRGWEGKASPTDEFYGDEKIEDILKIAVDAEKNSVVFYTGIKDLVPPKVGKDKIEAIIKEELGHIAALNKRLAELI